MKAADAEVLLLLPQGEGRSYPRRPFDPIRSDVRRLAGLPVSEVAIEKREQYYRGVIDSDGSYFYFALGPADGLVMRPVDPAEEMGAVEMLQRLQEAERQRAVEMEREKSR
jgi:hypothetical protein